MATDGEKPLNGKPEPFRRPVVWGRPPQTVFRAGPLPKGEHLPPLPEPPRPGPVGRSILGGSMIPRAPRSAPTATAPTVVPAPEPQPEPPAAMIDSPVPAPDLTVRSLPLPEPRPVNAAVPLSLDALPAFQPAVHDEPGPRSRPGTAGSNVVGKSPRRVVLYGGIAVAVITVLAVIGWVLSRSPAETPVAPAAPVAQEEAIVAAPAAVPPTPAVVPPPGPIVSPRPVEAPPPARLVPAPSPSPSRARPVPRAVQPPPVQAAPAVAPPPVIEIAPVRPPAPAPTAAERPSNDPDAPIATRPQPIG